MIERTNRSQWPPLLRSRVRVLLGHAHDQLLDLLGDTRSAKQPPVYAPVKPRRDQSLGPAQEGLWRHEGRPRFEAFPPKRSGERREALAFRVR